MLIRAISAAALLMLPVAALAAHIITADSADVDLPVNHSYQVEARCADNETAVSGGFLVRMAPAEVTVQSSYPSGDLRGWNAEIRNITNHPVKSRLSVQAICQ